MRKGQNEKSEAQRYFGATAGCMVQMLEGLTGTQDANVGHGIKGDAWFGAVRAAAALGVRGH